MSMEEQDLLRSAVREYSQKSIENNILKIEHDGISDELLKSLAMQGFLAARVPEQFGGSGIDESGYLAILEELAAFSPSVAATVMLVNSVVAPLIGEKSPELMKKVSAGETRVTISLSPVLEGSTSKDSLSAKSGKITGTLDNAAFSNGSAAIGLSSGGGPLYLVSGGLKLDHAEYGLSFRGLNFGKVSVDSGEFQELAEDGLKALSSVLDRADLAVAAIALGMSRGSLEKAIEYVKVRKTFDRPLKDYGPVASILSRLLGEYKVLSFALSNHEQKTEKENLMIKTLAVDLVKRATKYSLQFHGGYGYIEDFGVEKFYRDAVGLSILFQRPQGDGQRLAGEVFGEKSGYL